MEVFLVNTSSSENWVHNISEIEAGHSAVLSENWLAFYGIHCIAIGLIVTSLISCSVVITHILFCSRKDRWDFSDRFPLYLAIADGLWGISHLTDHMFLITTRTYPSTAFATVLSINLWFFLGYQQLMHAGLATYTYLKIVRNISLNLGKEERRLHLICLTFMAISVAIFYPLGSFGCSGYWFLQNVKTTEGRIFGFYIAFSATAHALCTTLGYRSIKKVVEKQKEAMNSYYDATKKDLKSSTLGPRKPSHHSTATQCLTTFVFIAVGLYCPLAIGYWAFVIESCFGIMEPLTALIIVIVANSSGWANAFGYFYNNKIKARREATKKKYSALPALSSNSTTSYGTTDNNTDDN